jgi:hypothetical protein
LGLVTPGVNSTYYDTTKKATEQQKYYHVEDASGNKGYVTSSSIRDLNTGNAITGLA